MSTIKAQPQQPFSKAETKEILKEAMREWLDSQFANFYRWSSRGILAAVFAGGVTLYLHNHWRF